MVKETRTLPGDDRVKKSALFTAVGGSGGQRRYRRQPYEHLIMPGIVLSILTGFLIDLVIPLGTTVWVVYFVPMMLSVWLWRPKAPFLVAAVITVLIVTSYLGGNVRSGITPQVVLTNRTIGTITFWVMALVGYLFIKARVAIRFQNWLQRGRTGLNEAVVGEQRISELGENILRFLADYIHAPVGALFIREGLSFRRIAALGVPHGAAIADSFQPDDGLLGRAVRERRTFIVSDVPEGYLSIGSGLGQSVPRHILIAPVIMEEEVTAVLELGFLHSPDETVVRLLEVVSEAIAIALRSAVYRRRLHELLEETQRQAEELQTQAEELRVSNEELEEQSRALAESQARLEQQQFELEQTNAQLEEQAEALARSKESLELHTRELAQASRYKSDFLANMSHELRTPLNSSLILAKLLADNPHGNLTEEQVRYAHTIQSAGNDLLTLINDILDLSKIEAGRMDIRPEELGITDVVEGLSRIFEPVAADKGLRFTTELAADLVPSVITDRQRLEQVLKNLLSNAIKFTERGEVRLQVQQEGTGVVFSVHDTGIGIPFEQREIIFEAFRQADGTTNRKYGGTGLGLSISRELTRLLGGDLRLASEPGKGSVFTVYLPVAYSPALVKERSPARPHAPLLRESEGVVRPPEGRAASTGHGAVVPHKGGMRRPQDDREQLAAGRRVILVVEDDEKFAKILYDMAHELDFDCLVAMTADEALALAADYLPNAVVLDIGLPDQSGLSVLDRLKRDTRTRHIPVHVVSGSDHALTALSLGAVGYLLKPVKREELANAIRQLEKRLTQQLRRILIVEDDAVQLDSLRQLLGSREVETVGVRTAADCLERLRTETFDCMVLDLSLPDTSGYALLETLSTQPAYSFPPVIVYTGRDLSAGEEQALRRYSESIIIKGAKSPERLLDEVTLFLHRVVAEMPPEQQRMLEQARNRDAALEGRHILIVEDDVRNIYALSSILEPRGVRVSIARNGREALELLANTQSTPEEAIDLVLMDVMMPEMDGLTATREIRLRPEWRKLPVIMLTAKAMKNDQEQCVAAGANDYMAKPLDVEKLLSLVRVWMPR